MSNKQQHINWFTNDLCYIPIVIEYDENDNVTAQVADCHDKGWQSIVPITQRIAMYMMFNRMSDQWERGFFMNHSCVFYATDLHYVFGICCSNTRWTIVRKRIDLLTPEEFKHMESAQDKILEL
jgi:hypothetical protein